MPGISGSPPCVWVNHDRLHDNVFKIGPTTESEDHFTAGRERASPTDPTLLEGLGYGDFILLVHGPGQLGDPNRQIDFFLFFIF